ncbi:MAG: hypothetical protein EAZ53_06055 [Bacteroidetes bacterium]|nr:MAG: hypothetical protein EAZ53_06055 [Bacteroidota bacterium]
MKGIYTILLLTVSNIFMNLSWYGHLQFKKWGWFESSGFFVIVLLSWGLAFFEYVVMIPANRIGFEENGGPFSLIQLKVIQEVISLTVFVTISILVFKTGKFTFNQLLALFFLVLAVYFTFKK